MSIIWFIFVAIVVIGIHVLIYQKFGLKKIQYQRSFSENIVFEGEKVEMIDEISNRKLLPIPWLRLESKIDEHLQFRRQVETDNEMKTEGYHRTMFSLKPYQKVRRRQSLICTKRGHYEFKTVSLTTGDVFGIQHTNQTVSSPAAITVYPKLIHLKELPLPAYSWLGETVVRRWVMEDPFMIAGVRDYMGTDSMDSINWKQTARLNQLQVYKRDFTADHNVMIYINFNQTEDAWRPIQNEEILEKAISYAASVAQYTIKNGLPTGFGCNAYMDENHREVIRIEPENSKQHIHRLMQTFAMVKMGVTTHFEFFLEEDVKNRNEQTDYLLITSIVTEKMKTIIQQLETLGNSVEVIMLDMDQEQQKGAS